MKRVLLVAALCLSLTFAASAQDSSAPSGFAPASAAYIEIDISDDSLSFFEEDIVANILPFAPSPDAMPDFDMLAEMLVNELIPGFVAGEFTLGDVQAWSGEQIGVTFDPTQSSERVLILPISDFDGAQAFAEQIATAAAETSGDTAYYPLGDTTLALTSDVVLIGTRSAVDTSLSLDQILTDDPSFVRVMDELPDASVRVYIGGSILLSQALSAGEDNGASQIVRSALDAALRLHPAESEAEDALLSDFGLDGIGAAVFPDGGRIYLQVALALDASYADESGDPTSALFALMPTSSTILASSRDLLVPADTIIMLALLGPTINDVFNSIVATLQDPNATPPERAAVPSADDFVAQGNAIFAQVFTAAGTDMDEFYDLVSGEYALAMFPSIDGQGLRVALWIDTPDSARLLEIFKGAMGYVAQASSFSAPEDRDAEGRPAFIAEFTPGNTLGFVALDDNTVAVTTIDDAMNIVLGVQDGDVASIPEALIYPVEAQGDIKIYATLEGLTRAGLIPPLPISGLTGGTLETRADGVFVLTLMVELQ